MGSSGPGFSRRSFLGVSALPVLAGFVKHHALVAYGGALCQFKNAKLLGLLTFLGEARVPLNTITNEGLDARLYSDISSISPKHFVTPSEMFYLRTAAPELQIEDPWTIRIDGRVHKLASIGAQELNGISRNMGFHLMECSGNARATRFGLIGVASWKGVAISDILEAKVKPQSDRVMISGVDVYKRNSATSISGADWVFTVEQLKATGAFLATEMNGQPLSKNHGAPVRLVVPGWYGCTCIKWVNSVTFVDENAPSTSQMREFASRTHQQGIPSLAKDFYPATIEQAAMPIRVEKWLVDEHIRYKVVGILWGGTGLVRSLEIRFNPEEEYVRVGDFTHTTNDPWSFWSHWWDPPAVGTYTIRLRVANSGMETKRLDAGYYARSVEVTEI